jgi:quercetin dioxygenase-like cupin family protein
MKAGNAFNNPVTGESGYIRKGTVETNGELLIADLRVRPGGAVVGEHYHPTIRERFTVVKGEIRYKLGKKEGTLLAGQTLDLPPGIPHDWWNAGTHEARVIVQVKPAARFEQMILTMFGLAREGKTDKRGLPNLLQLAVTSMEFKDVMRLTAPPVWLQNILFSFLAPIGRLLGYKAAYPHHQTESEMVKIEPLPDHLIVEELR